MKILPRGKSQYRYFNNGQFIEKKDMTKKRESLDQLNLSKKLAKKNLLGIINPDKGDHNKEYLKFEDIKSVKTYHDSIIP